MGWPSRSPGVPLRCLFTLAFTRQHQTGAIIAQRPSSVRMTNNARKPLNIRRKSRFAVLAVLEIHLALHVPKSESLQLFDSQPQRLRPSDSVRLTGPGSGSAVQVFPPSWVPNTSP